MRISVHTAAKMMGICEQTIRVGMQQGLFDIGFVYGEGKNKTYIIYDDKVLAQMGRGKERGETNG